MTETPETVPNSVNGRLADYFAERQESIIEDWLTRVRHDAEIPSETLSIAALKNHLPRLFDDLISTLRSYGSQAVADQTLADAVSHATTRWRQGFHLTGVLRELMHLRADLIQHLCRFEELNPEFGITERFFALTTLHRFIDEVGMEACEQFLVEENHERLAGQLIG